MTVVAVAGRIGAGKSAIADATAAAIGARRRSFGQVIREIAEECDLPTDRSSLQDLGEQIIADEGWTTFVARVLPDGVETVVIDGVRHLAAVRALRAGARDAFLLVFVQASFEQRHARVAARDHVTRSQFEAANRHPNEAEVTALRGVADVVIDNEQAGGTALAEAVETIAIAVQALRP